jgi:hypothetical protein
MKAAGSFEKLVSIYRTPLRHIPKDQYSSSLEAPLILNCDSKTSRKMSPGRCRHRWEDNIVMDIRESGYEHVDFTALVWLNIKGRTVGFHKRDFFMV